MAVSASITGTPFGLYDASGPITGGGVSSLTAGNTAITFSAGTGAVTASSTVVYSGTVQFTAASTVTVTLAAATANSVVLTGGASDPLSTLLVVNPTANSFTVSTADGSTITELVDWILINP